MKAPRPSAAPELLAALTAAAPARLVRKLDQAPATAEAWTWAMRDDGGVTVTTDGGDQVELRPEGGRLSTPGQVSCSCLLAPRCLHVLAVAMALPVDDGNSAAAERRGVADGPGATEGRQAEPAVLTREQQEAATAALRALAEVLASGGQGAGLVLQGELLRSLHGCRACGLPRLSANLLTVLAGLRACREESADFVLRDFAHSLAEAVGTARGLSRFAGVSATDIARLIGTARREYAEVGSLRLHGFFSEPVLTASGFAGVVTWLIDSGGRSFSVSDVAPGGPERIAAAYAGAARLGGGVVNHRDLGRTGLHVEGATASPDGRLGAGQGVRAVRAGPSHWSAAPLAALFEVSLGAQLDRAVAAMTPPAEPLSPLDGLICFEAVVVGSNRRAVLLEVERGVGVPHRLHGVVGSSSPDLPWRDNLSLLAGSAGLRLRCVARPQLDCPPEVVLLAAEPLAGPGEGSDRPGPSESSLVFPREWGGRCNLGLDRIQGAHRLASSAPGAPPQAPARIEAAEELLALRRRQERLALGGRSTIFPAAMDAVEREARQLETLLMPTAAGLLRGLAAAALDRSAGRAARLAEAFLAVHSYIQIAERSARQAAWSNP